MKLFHFSSSLIGLSMLTLAGVTQAATGWGVQASTSSSSNCPSYCTSANGGQFAYDTNGGQYAPSAYATVNAYSYAQASAALAGPDDLPILKAEATADLGRGAGATAFALQAYTYTGSISQTIQLGLSLTGTVGNNPTGYTYNVISASIAVISGDALSWYPDYSTLVYEIAQPGTVLDSISMGIAGSATSDSDTLEFELNPGDVYYVVASLSAISKNGFADAFSTLKLEYLDENGDPLGNIGLVSATAAVPVPGAVWMMGSALAMMVGVGRRRHI